MTNYQVDRNRFEYLLSLRNGSIIRGLCRLRRAGNRVSLCMANELKICLKKELKGEPMVLIETKRVSIATKGANGVTKLQTNGKCLTETGP